MGFLRITLLLTFWCCYADKGADAGAPSPSSSTATSGITHHIWRPWLAIDSAEHTQHAQHVQQADYVSSHTAQLTTGSAEYTQHAQHAQHVQRAQQADDVSSQSAQLATDSAEYTQHAQRAQQADYVSSQSARRSLVKLDLAARADVVQCKKYISFITIQLRAQCNDSFSAVDKLAECLRGVLERAVPIALASGVEGIDVQLEGAAAVRGLVEVLQQDETVLEQVHVANLVLSVSLSVEAVLQHFLLCSKLRTALDYINILPGTPTYSHFVLYGVTWLTRVPNLNWVVEAQQPDTQAMAADGVPAVAGSAIAADTTWMRFLSMAQRFSKDGLNCAQLKSINSGEAGHLSDGLEGRSLLQVVHLTDLGDNTTFPEFNVSMPPGVTEARASAVVHQAPSAPAVSAHQDPNWLAITIIPGLAVVSLMVLAFRRLLYPKPSRLEPISEKRDDGDVALVEQQLPGLTNPSFLKLLCHVQPSTGVGWVSEKTASLTRTSVPMLLLKVAQHSSQGSSITDAGLARMSEQMVDLKQADVDMQIDLTADIEVPDDPNALLGQGAYGWVYKGIYKGHPVAVKLLSRMFKEGYIPPQDLAQFEQEMHILSKVRHENIVHLFGGCLVPPNIFLVEELLEFSLADYVHGRRAPMPLAELLAVIRGVACGLCVLHPSIIHRDLKPGNVLLDRHGSIKISDFGLARAKMTSYLSTQNLMAGTIPYMAPECFNGQRGAVTEKTDIYSLAVIMVECLTGRSPWEGWDSVGILCQVAVQKKRPKIPDDPAVCPPQLRSLIQDCWKTNPQDRPSAEQVVQRVTDMQEQLQQKLPPSHMFERPPPCSSSHSSSSCSQLALAPLQDVDEGMPSIPEYQPVIPEQQPILPGPSTSTPPVSLSSATASPYLPQPPVLFSQASQPGMDTSGHISAHNSAHSSAHNSVFNSSHNSTQSSVHNAAPSSAHAYPHNSAHNSARTSAHNSAHNSGCSSTHTSTNVTPHATQHSTPVPSPRRSISNSPWHTPPHSSTRPNSKHASPDRTSGAAAYSTSVCGDRQHDTGKNSAIQLPCIPTTLQHDGCVGSDPLPNSIGSDDTCPLLHSPPATVPHTPVTSPSRGGKMRSPALSPGATSPVSPRPSAWNPITAISSMLTPPQRSAANSATATPTRSPAPRAHRELFPDQSVSPSSYIRDRPEPSVLHALMTNPVLRSPPRVLHGSHSPPHVTHASSHVTHAPSHVTHAPSHVTHAPSHVTHAPSRVAHVSGDSSSQPTSGTPQAVPITRMVTQPALDPLTAQQALQQALVQHIVQQATTSAPPVRPGRFVSPFAGHSDLALLMQATQVKPPPDPPGSTQ